MSSSEILCTVTGQIFGIDSEVRICLFWKYLSQYLAVKLAYKSVKFWNHYIIISAVKISTLTQVINFSRLTVLKIFNTGAGLGFATPLTAAAFVFIYFFLFSQRMT